MIEYLQSQNAWISHPRRFSFTPMYRTGGLENAVIYRISCRPLLTLNHLTISVDCISSVIIQSSHIISLIWLNHITLCIRSDVLWSSDLIPLIWCLTHLIYLAIEGWFAKMVLHAHFLYLHNKQWYKVWLFFFEYNFFFFQFCSLGRMCSCASLWYCQVL